VFSSATGVTSTTSFDINAFSIPNNDDCAEAVALGLNGPVVAGTVAGATMSMSACATQTLTSSEDDVWYSFIAQTATDSIIVNSGANGASFDAVVELYSGTCGALTSMGCINATGAGQKEALKPTTLIPTSVYYVRVYDASNTEVATPDFTIAVQGMISSTRKAEVESSLNIYPVPSNYLITVNFTAPVSDDISLKLVGTDGRTVYTNTVVNTSGEVNEKINVSNLNKGIYLLQITVDGEIVSKKIVVN
jgi:trimeric autotransporter adhesin